MNLLEIKDSVFNFTEEVECTCNDCIDEETGDTLVYECSGCNRLVPWCFGSGDELIDYCDDCYCEIQKNN